MPGHTVEALAAYPGWAAARPGRDAPALGRLTRSLCPTERTFAFVDDVLAEVAALFPGPYSTSAATRCPRTLGARAPSWRR